MTAWYASRPRVDLAVAVGALSDLALPLDGLGGSGELLGVEARLLDLRAGQLDEAMEQLECMLRVARVGGALFVRDVLDDPGLERTAVRELQEPEPVTPLGNDVEAAVVETIEHLGHRRARPDLAQTGLAGEDEAELALLREALADQLLIAVLEDVQRNLLRRQQDDPQREEAELAHARSLDALERRDPEQRAVALRRAHEPTRLDGALECSRRMHEDAEAAPAQPLVEVHGPEARPGPPDAAREAEDERSPRQGRRGPGERDSVGCAADDLVHHDEVDPRGGRRIGDQICGPERDPLADTRLERQLVDEPLVVGHELDDLRRCGAGLQQLERDLTDAAADLEHARALETARARTPRERPRHRVGPLAPVPTGVVGGRLLAEELLLAVSGAAAGHWDLRPKWPRDVIAITVTPSWFTISARIRIVPRSAFVADGVASSTVSRPVSVSPGRTGASQRSSSIPGEPRAAEPSIASTYIRIQIAPVCQPLAISPPKTESLAASGSTWNGCGSHCRAKSTISSSVTVRLPSS